MEHFIRRKIKCLTLNQQFSCCIKMFLIELDLFMADRSGRSLGRAVYCYKDVLMSVFIIAIQHMSTDTKTKVYLLKKENCTLVNESL